MPDLISAIGTSMYGGQPAFAKGIIQAEDGSLIDESTGKPIGAGQAPYAKPGFGMSFFAPETAASIAEFNRKFQQAPILAQQKNAIERQLIGQAVDTIPYEKWSSYHDFVTPAPGEGYNLPNPADIRNKQRNELITQIRFPELQNTFLNQQSAAGAIPRSLIDSTALTKAQGEEVAARNELASQQFTEQNRGLIQDISKQRFVNEYSKAFNLDPLTISNAVVQAGYTKENLPGEQELYKILQGVKLSQAKTEDELKDTKSQIERDQTLFNLGYSATQLKTLSDEQKTMLLNAATKLQIAEGANKAAPFMSAAAPLSAARELYSSAVQPLTLDPTKATVVDEKGNINIGPNPISPLSLFGGPTTANGLNIVGGLPSLGWSPSRYMKQNVPSTNSISALFPSGNYSFKVRPKDIEIIP